ncbi:MAG: hypothetical protein ABI624_05780 [Casimicrobiaceae bacterium]
MPARVTPYAEISLHNRSVPQFARSPHNTRFFLAFSQRRRAAARSRRSYFASFFLGEKRGKVFFPRFSPK